MTIDLAPMRPEEMIVYLVSNDSARAKRLKQFFLSRDKAIVSFTSLAEYRAGSKNERIACLVLDLDFPNHSMLDVQRQLAGSDAPPIVFVAKRGDTISGVRAMKNGAIDFLIEPLDYRQLIASVELAFAVDQQNRNKRFERTALLACWKTLTPREAEVFSFTTAGLLNKQAAADLGITENTYQVHRGRVMRKMKANSLADLVRMSMQLEATQEARKKVLATRAHPHFSNESAEFRFETTRIGFQITRMQTSSAGAAQ